MVVYGPQGDAEKLQFLRELRTNPALTHGRWLILGDFNLIYQAKDKNNTNLNRQLMGAFKAVIDDLSLKEIELNGRTWSNEQDNLTLTRIDRFFCTMDWELTFPTCFLHSVPSLMQTTHTSFCRGSLSTTAHVLSLQKFFRYTWTASSNCGADLEQTHPLCLSNQAAAYKLGKGSKRHQEVAQGKNWRHVAATCHHQGGAAIA
jgi:hypothetical protein